MKAAVDAKALAAAVGRVAPFASRATTSMPVLACIKVEARDGALVLTATDIEHSATTTVEAEVSDPGALLAPASVLGRAVGVLDGTLDLVAELGSFDIAAGGESITVITPADADGFPRIDLDTAELVALGTVWDDVLAVSHAASTDAKWPDLRVVGFDGGSVFATDSHRLAWADAPGTPDLLVPIAGIRRAAKALDGEILLASTGQAAVFTDAATLVSTQLHAGQAKAWRNVVDLERPHELTIDAVDLLAALAVVDALSDEGSNAVKMALDGDQVTLTRTVGGVGTAVATANARGEWPEPHLGVSSVYLADAVRAVGGDTVTIRTNGYRKPLSVHGGSGVSVVLMPIKLPGDAW